MSATFSVRAPQYIRPNGRKASITCYLVPIDVQEDYIAMQEAGARIEREVLTTGEVSLTIAYKGEDVDIRVVPNGPEVIDALVSMLKARNWAYPQRAQ